MRPSPVASPRLSTGSKTEAVTGSCETVGADEEQQRGEGAAWATKAALSVERNGTHDLVIWRIGEPQPRRTHP
jgi:hypothetical protein